MVPIPQVDAWFQVQEGRISSERMFTEWCNSIRQTARLNSPPRRTCAVPHLSTLCGTDALHRCGHVHNDVEKCGSSLGLFPIQALQP